jgi:hypothetical protein
LRSDSEATVASPPSGSEAVEKFSIDQVTMSNVMEFSLRVHNSGTASLTIAKLLFDGKPSEIVGISSGNGTLENGRVVIRPGDSVTVSFKPPSPDHVASVMIGYPVTVVTEGGNQNTVNLTLP